MFKEKHVFAGNNTSIGFFSYFDFIINPEDANHIYILKGGPGVGKSSFMKKFAIHMITSGYSVEYIHCSSDNDSLDAIVVPQLNLAFIDGTAPHTVDPKIPGAVDEIINLGIFLNSKELEKHKNQIIQINKNKSQLYKSAYRYLESAGLILEEINSIYDSLSDNEKFNLICDNALKNIFLGKESRNNGKIRKLFSEAYTANGYISYTDSLCQNKTIWTVEGENLNYTSKLLNSIAIESVKRGFDTECYYHPLNPVKLQHILIPELDVIIKTENNHNYLGSNNDKIINLHAIVNSERLKEYITQIENNLNLFDLLIQNALEKLSETKKYHELLEVFYVNSMDFKGVNDNFDFILTQYI